MKQKLLFIWHILIFNIIKPLPKSSGYFNKHFRLSSRNVANHRFPSHYMAIVKFGKEKSGWIGITLANTALMLFCLPFCFSADLIIHKTHLISLKIAVNLILVLAMSGKFDVLRVRDNRNYLKVFYLFSCLVSSSYWTLTCVFLATFENIAI